MSDYQQKVSGSFSERKRLNRLRRRKEKLRFWEEFRIVPRWLVATVAILYVIAVVVAITVNLAARNDPNGNDMFPQELRYSPALASLALAGIVTAVSLSIATIIFLVAYVNRDAKRRGMSPALWTFLVIILLPGYLVIGFMVYFLMREPLPYPCPQCATAVGARFNFCPNCKCNLHPSCPNCKREVFETDKFCPYCAHELVPSTGGIPAPADVHVAPELR
jgi:ABC-type Fe3+ transport system permease subunit